MKVRTYIRVAKKAPGSRSPHYMLKANVTPSTEPLYSGPEPLPTVSFAIDLDLPDEMFKTAERVIAEIVIPPEAAEIAATVYQEEQE